MSTVKTIKLIGPNPGDCAILNEGDEETAAPFLKKGWKPEALTEEAEANPEEKPAKKSKKAREEALTEEAK
jgi:hypothetical protein